MNTLDYITKRYNITNPKAGTEILGTRHKDLLEIFRDLDFRKGAEIGVEQGVFAEEICKTNPQLTLFCVDPWQAYEGYFEHTEQEKLDNFHDETVKRLAPYSAKIIREHSEVAYKQFEDSSLDFVYIDGNHEYFYVAQDLHFWIPKVKPGGIVAGHDFRRNSRKFVNDVKDVIPSFAYAKRISPWFILREPIEASSWFWIKS